MRLRIVGGELGGRRIRAPNGRRTRPTREAVREAWFSALGPRIAGARVLDLFAGSGALGIEALSRGAAWVDFVEGDRRTAALLRRNLAELGLVERSHTSCREVFAFLDNIVGEGAYDVALADPPYGTGDTERLVERFRRAPFAALLCVEHASESLREAMPDWHRRYGDTSLSFFSSGNGGSSGGA
ncbi:MAG: 16S rRNA (guanine(966)-N(2))-methyltransferase RsmD [Gemmatimonadota bacterium]